MNVRKQVPWTALLAVVLVAALPLAAMAQQQRETEDPPHAEQMHKYMQERMEKHLDRLAARLEIRASQQEAWKAFASAVRATVPAAPPAPPPKDLDAAALARRGADRAADRAKHLEQLADATAKLQQALDPPQREVLNQAARHFAHRMHEMGAHGGMGHCDGHHEHEGHGHGDGMHDG